MNPVTAAGGRGNENWLMDLIQMNGRANDEGHIWKK